MGLWIAGRDDKFRGLKPVIEREGCYLSGYRAASDYLAASESKDSSPDADHTALRMCFENQTQLSSIAGAVRQLSARVSEIEQQLSRITTASRVELGQSTVQSVIPDTDPALYLLAISAFLEKTSSIFREIHRAEWTFTDSAADSISRYASKIENLSHNFQKPATK